MTYWWGVDSSTTRLAVACCRKGAVPVLRSFRIRGKPGDERLWFAMSELLVPLTALAQECPPMLVCIENPRGRFRNQPSYEMLGVVRGLLYGACPEGTRHRMMTPTEWKKRATGAGTTSKEAYMEWAQSAEPANDDEAAALGVAVAASVEWGASR